MPIDKYICPTFEEDIEGKKLISRALNSHHSEGYERKFFEGLLKIVNESPFNTAFIEGVVKGTPMDPSPENPLTEKLKWVAFHPQWKKEWEVLQHKTYMLVPYSKTVRAATPIFSVEFHTRKYKGRDTKFIAHDEIQQINRIRYDQGRTTPMLMGYDPEGAKKRKELRKNSENSGAQNKIADLLDEFEFDNLNAPQLGPGFVLPENVPSGKIKESRYKIWEFIYVKGNQLPQGWGEADFYELGYSSMRRIAGLPQEDLDLNMMEGFYNNDKIEFVDISQFK